MQKLWEKQERKLREMKSNGVSKLNAEKAQLKQKAREPGKSCVLCLLVLMRGKEKRGEDSLCSDLDAFIAISFSFFLSLSISLHLSPSFFLSLSIFLSLFLSHYFSLSLSPSLSLFLPSYLSLSLPSYLSHSLYFSLSLSINNVLGARAKKAEAAAASSGGLESGESKVELIKRPRDYAVTFSFPEVLFVRNFRLYEEIGKNKKERGKREQEKRKKEIEEEKGRGKKGIGKEGKRKIGDGRGEKEKGKGNGIV